MKSPLPQHGFRRDAASRLMLLVLCLSTFAIAQTTRSSPNLLQNPGLEERGEHDAPPHWRAVTVWGAPATFAIDADQAHGGGQSFRISSTESTQSFLRSDPIDVAPGETIRASAWVKVRDIAAKHADGGVGLTAEFLNGDGRTEQFARFAKVTMATTPAANSAWQHVGGSVKVPPLAATVRLRLAFFDCAGTAWFDDALLEAETPIALRIDLPSELLTPQRGGLPVLLINRDGRRDDVHLHGRLGDSAAEVTVKLSGATTQPCVVPVSIATRGKLQAEASLAGIVQKRNLLVPPPLMIDPPIPTHWVRADGPPAVTVNMYPAIAPAEMEDGLAQLEIVDQTGTSQVRDILPLPVIAASGWSWRIAAPRLRDGQYRIVVALNVKGEPPIKVEQRWTVVAEREKVTVGDDGFLHVGHRTIFPLGVFNGSGRMKELGEAGFTIAHTYNSVEAEIGGRLDHAQALAYLDAAEAAGMKALMLIPRKPLFAGDMETIRERVRMFRNHPALLAWDEEEGIARGDMTPQRLAELRKLIAEEDPNHPLMVGDSRDVITKVPDRSNFFPADSMDLGMWWWYPIPPLGPKGGALGGDEITAGNELVPPAFLTLSKLKQPLWVGLQSYKKPQSYGRFPTPAEYRAQAYLAVIHGAKGLMWYGGSVEGGIFLHPEEGHWDELKTLVRELHEMADVFASPSEPAPTFEPKDAPISVALKRSSRGRVLLAVNRGAQPVEVTFKLPWTAGEIRIEGEDRTVKAQGKDLTDHFTGYAMHVYRFTKPSQ